MTNISLTKKEEYMGMIKVSYPFFVFYYLTKKTDN